mgnify:CR=1 FL=1
MDEQWFWSLINTFTVWFLSSFHAYFMFMVCQFLGEFFMTTVSLDLTFTLFLWLFFFGSHFYSWWSNWSAEADLALGCFGSIQVILTPTVLSHGSGYYLNTCAADGAAEFCSFESFLAAACDEFEQMMKQSGQWAMLYYQTTTLFWGQMRPVTFDSLPTWLNEGHMQISFMNQYVNKYRANCAKYH